MLTNPNRDIYNEKYTDKNVSVKFENPYDAWLDNYYLSLVEKNPHRESGSVIRGRMLDEDISSAWPFKHLAFRHMFICQKQ